jgi:hypothetical protein
VVQIVFAGVALAVPVILGGLVIRLVTLVRLGWPRTAALTVLLTAVPPVAVAAAWVVTDAGAGILEALGVGVVATLTVVAWAALARRAARGRPPALPADAVPAA